MPRARRHRYADGPRRAPLLWLGLGAGLGLGLLLGRIGRPSPSNALRYTVLYTDEQSAFIESASHGVREIPLAWLPQGVKEGQCLLAAPSRGNTSSVARFALAENP